MDILTDMNEISCGAVVLSAGFSSRMGKYKPFMSLGGGTLLENQVGLLKSAGIVSPVVVAGFRADELMTEARKLGVRVAVNSRFSDGMFSSVLTGLKALSDDITAFFLLPVDVPLVTGITILRLYRSFAENGALITYPVFEGRRGHPPLISSDLVPEIMAHDGGGGLRTVLERHNSDAVEVETGNRGILLDMDTPEAYENIVGMWEQRQIPSVEDCRKLLDLYNTPERVRLHSEMTASTAASLCRLLNDHGCVLSVELAERAGMLHDIAKARPDHAAEGARILKLYGYDLISGMTGSHMELDYRPGEKITETEVLFLSDKLLEGTELRPLEVRLAASLKRKGSFPEIRRNIESRFASAERIADAVEKIIGGSVYSRLANSSCP